MKRIYTLIIALAVLAPLNVFAQTYKINPAHTSIQFKVRNLGIMNVKGNFEKFKGIVDIDDTDITKSKVDVSIETTSINTGINKRDKHLRSPDFFDVVKFPDMTFVSTKVEAGTNKDKLKVTGNLTIKGVTKEVVLIVEGPNSLLGDRKREATAAATVNRQDFGVSWGAIIADEVYITIKTELVKQ
ncbi:MAG: YceI family protein [Geobacteraceae bacterium]